MSARLSAPHVPASPRPYGPHRQRPPPIALEGTLTSRTKNVSPARTSYAVCGITGCSCRNASPQSAPGGSRKGSCARTASQRSTPVHTGTQNLRSGSAGSLPCRSGSVRVQCTFRFGFVFRWVCSESALRRRPPAESIKAGPAAPPSTQSPALLLLLLLLLLSPQTRAHPVDRPLGEREDHRAQLRVRARRELLLADRHAGDKYPVAVVADLRVVGVGAQPVGARETRVLVID